MHRSRPGLLACPRCKPALITAILGPADDRSHPCDCSLTPSYPGHNAPACTIDPPPKYIQVCPLFPVYYTLGQDPFKIRGKGLPWWLSDKEPACQCRRHGFDPWFEKIWHAMEQLSPCAHNYWDCALEPGSHSCWAHRPQLLKPECCRAVLHSKSTHCCEKPSTEAREVCGEMLLIRISVYW